MLENTNIGVLLHTPGFKVGITGTAVVSLALGAAAGYFVADRVLQAKYEQIVKDEIADAKIYYSMVHKKDGYASPVQMAEDLIDVEVTTLQDLSSGEEIEVVRTDEMLGALEIVSNIFSDERYISEDDVIDFDYEAEEATRTEDKPYVISKDEFDAKEKDYEQSSLTYYPEDDILADDHNAPVPDIDALVGISNLERFGVGSNDNNTVYIRNEYLEIEFEVTRSKETFAKDVFGYIEHSESRGLRKFRDYE